MIFLLFLDGRIFKEHICLSFYNRAYQVHFLNHSTHHNLYEYIHKEYEHPCLVDNLKNQITTIFYITY